MSRRRIRAGGIWLAERGPRGDVIRETVLAAVTDRAAGLRDDRGFGHYGGEVPWFLDEDKSGWQFRFGWMMGRLNGENRKDGRTVGVGLETPFLRWPVLDPTQLPNGQVVFQLGWNQTGFLIRMRRRSR